MEEMYPPGDDSCPDSLTEMSCSPTDPAGGLPVVIIGGGITGLSLAAKLHENGRSFILLEKENRLGGQIRTLTKDGFVYEVGPNTGIISCPEVAELFKYAGLSPLIAQESAKYRWIWKKERFHSLPTGLWSAVATPLFRKRDKFRILFEPWRKKGVDPNESVGSLAERRLGKSFVKYAVDPFIGGIYAGDPYRLVTRYALPRLYNLEYNHGSFVRGALAKRKEPKTERDRLATKETFSAPGGLQKLVDAVAAKASAGGTFVLGAQELTINPGSDVPGANWTVTYKSAAAVASAQGASEVVEVAASHVVTTVPAYALKEIFSSKFVVQHEAEFTSITNLEYAPVTEVVVGFHALPGINRLAFGGLVPSCEGRKILGVLFPSSCFTQRVPQAEGALFSIFMGGVRQRNMVENASDNELAEIALSELYDMLKITPTLKPDLVHVARYPRAIPQYTETSGERFAAVQRLEELYPGLAIAGNLKDGIGLPQRIQQGAQLGLKLSQEVMSVMS